MTSHSPKCIDILPKVDIEKMKRPELQAYAINLSTAYSNLYDTLFNPNNGVIPRLESQLAIANNTNQILLKKLIDVERISYSNAQYSRKESIELSGFDPSIPNEEIEGKVVNLLNFLKDDQESPYSKDDIQACHKVKNPKNVICKFVKRRRMRQVVNNRKKVKGKDLKNYGIPGKLFINESLSPAYKQIDWKCRQLKKGGYIKQSWFFNGKYKVELLNGNIEVVGHSVDIEKLMSMTEDEINKVCNDCKQK